MSSITEKDAITPSQSFAPPHKVHLTDRQLHALKACSNGISLRFEGWEVVNPLIEAGFAKKNLAGVIIITEEGRRYLRSESRFRGSAHADQ